MIEAPWIPEKGGRVGNMPRVVRWLSSLVGLGIGFASAYYLLPIGAAVFDLYMDTVQTISVLIFGSLLGFLILYAASPWVYSKCVNLVGWVEGRLQRTPFQDIVAGAVGLIIGLIIANLLGSAFSGLPAFGMFVPTVSSIIFGYLGVVVALRKREDIAALVPLLPRLKARERQDKGMVQPKILDTSVIIDGRIADICRTGFVEGTMVIPGFVLEELRHIADSSDTLKRNRGRRGLDVLSRIQKDMGVNVLIYDKDVAGISEVDSKLVRLAKILDGKVLTNDFNLNKIAELQGVQVLNINELANAVKPVVLPGEDMLVHVIKDGKETGQGVGYLDDGTMIVVDGGKKHIGETIGVCVTSVLQTAAGRMIFAKPKTSMEKAIS